MIRVTFVQTAEAPVAELRENIGPLGYGEPIIQQFGKPNEISIRMRLPEGSDRDPGLADQMAQKITATLKAEHPDARIDGVEFGLGQGLGRTVPQRDAGAARGDGRRSRSTSGFASNGSSGWARCSRWSTT